MMSEQYILKTVKQYEMAELVFEGCLQNGNEAQVDLWAEFFQEDQVIKVKGFYAGNGVYKVRFLPEKTGICKYKIHGVVEDHGMLEVVSHDEKHRGIIRAKGTHFEDETGKIFHPFGTTVYALIHQEKEIIEKTYRTLKDAPFNKIRICIFPKYFVYNENEPDIYPFEKGSNGWDPEHPCYEFWDRLDQHIMRLDDLGIQVDLILFHPYDKWGFSEMSREKNLVYLDYAVRRLAAYPNLWWSLANEYEVCAAKEIGDWHEFEKFIEQNDVWRHLISCHNIGQLYDPGRDGITHISAQTKLFTKIDAWRLQYQKPVIVDECCYEGNLKELWGSISGKELTRRFWRSVISGAYCTHGETFYDPEDIIWWAKGGILKGESPDRIRFCRNVIESLPGHIHRVPGEQDKILEMVGKSEQELEGFIQKDAEKSGSSKESVRHIFHSFASLEGDANLFVAADYEYNGCIGSECYLHYHDFRTPAKDMFDLPLGKNYVIRVIDTWLMTDYVAAENVSGRVWVDLPGKEDILVMAILKS